jgi:phage terminase small subunit
MKNGRTKKEVAALNKDADMMLKNTEDLTDRERLFIAYYLQSMDAPTAARCAGYSGTPLTVRRYGWTVIDKPKIRKVIDEHLRQAFMGAAESKVLMSDQARATVEDFITFNDGNDSFVWNLKQARDRGKLGLVKKLKTKERFTTDGERIVETEVELHDSQSALVNVGKLHSLYKETINIETNKGDTPFDLMSKAYAAAAEKGEKIKQCRHSRT